ncbi:MAG: DUF805 domain-containing protein [Hylemonella sp.]|nr:DUF805 domain-containing protein [Hylemonella sp.]
MTFTESIQTGLSRLTDFSGRSGRSEYGWFGLFLLLALGLLALGIALASRFTGLLVPSGSWVLLQVPLALAVAAAQVRRLRDAGFSPWWALANLIPYAGIALLLAPTLLPSAGRAAGADQAETNFGSLSSFSLMMVSGWSALTGAAPLAVEKPARRSRLPLIALVLLAVSAVLLVYVYSTSLRDPAPQPVPAPAAPVPTAPRSEHSLTLMDQTSGVRLYVDASTARSTGPDSIAIQLVFDFGQARERNGVRFFSLKQNEVFNCAERSSSWTTRFYMSEPMGEGEAVFIEEGKGSLLDMSDSDTGDQRLAMVCRLLPGLAAPKPAASAPVN